ncbi:HupE / UreJ protein [Pseudooceanicola antarcticus]|nr:HupE/UreJ family protein [Pseudooceanicola antarcticus]SNY52447.1 HupE / UreJ protein [Pseudooceanicola antarcticus]
MPLSTASFAVSDQTLTLELVLPVSAVSTSAGDVRAWHDATAPLTLVTLDGLYMPKVLSAELGAKPGAGLSQRWRLRLSFPEIGPRETLQFNWFDGAGRLMLQPALASDKSEAVLVNPGQRSERISFQGQSVLSPAVAFLAYIPRGFGLVLGQGAQYVLFLLAVCMVSPRSKPQLMQVGLYAAGSTIALWVGALVTTLPVWLSGLPLLMMGIGVTLAVVAANFLRPYIGAGRLALVALASALHGLALGQALRGLGLPVKNEIAAILGAGMGLWAGYAIVLLGFFVLLGNWVGHERFMPRRIRHLGSLLVGAGAIALLLGRALA